MIRPQIEYCYPDEYRGLRIMGLQYDQIPGQARNDKEQLAF